MLVASVTRLDSKCEQIVSRASGTRLDTIGRSVGGTISSDVGSPMVSVVCSTMGSAMESAIGRSMGSSIGKGELAFVFELIENVIRSKVKLFSKTDDSVKNRFQNVMVNRTGWPIRK